MNSKYYKWNKKGSKIVIDTGYKTFDNYIVCISRGNVIGGGQTSFYIRPYNTIQCNNKTHEAGYLRSYDLNMFYDLDYNVKKYVESITEDESCILYEFYTIKHGTKNKVGYIVEQNGFFKIFNNNFYAKSKKQKCLEFIVKVLEEEYENR